MHWTSPETGSMPNFEGGSAPSISLIRIFKCWLCVHMLYAFREWAWCRWIPTRTRQEVRMNETHAVHFYSTLSFRYGSRTKAYYMEMLRLRLDGSIYKWPWVFFWWMIMSTWSVMRLLKILHSRLAILIPYQRHLTHICPSWTLIFRYWYLTIDIWLIYARL
jgi:hypothetical protein